MKISVCLGGATGWVGSELVRAIINDKRFELVAAISRKQAGKRLSDVLGAGFPDFKISKSVSDALNTKCDVYIDYTKPDVVKTNVVHAISKNIHVVIGASGLTEHDFQEIDQLARQSNVGVFAAVNFALTAALLQKFCEYAAAHVPSWEIIDYAYEGKPDAPSSTARDLSARLSAVQKPVVQVPVQNTFGLRESRGGTIGGAQVHSVRLPGFVFGIETIFGMTGERLVIKHEAGSSAVPYVKGTLLAAEKVSAFIGLKRGLDQIVELNR
jgi:4-hydroxy-tetrahydrodipicolinate reductase